MEIELELDGWIKFEWLAKKKKKRGYYLRAKNSINQEKVKNVLEKVRKAYFWEYFEEIAPGLYSRVPSHMWLFTFKVTKIKQN